MASIIPARDGSHDCPTVPIDGIVRNAHVQAQLTVAFIKAAGLVPQSSEDISPCHSFPGVFLLEYSRAEKRLEMQLIARLTRRHTGAGT